LSAIAAAVIGLIMSYPLARTKGFAFFIASYAAGEAMRLCWTRFKVPFGGWSGLVNIPPPGNIGAIDFGRPTPYYFLTLTVTAVCLWLMYRLGRSRIGATFHAIHLQDSLAKSIGINITRYRVLVFVVAAFFAGVAGVLLVHRMWAIEPNQFGFVPTLYLLVWAVFGGTRTFAGPILGVAVLTLVGELLVPLAEWVPLIYGCILILTLLFLPEGLEGLPGRLSRLSRSLTNKARIRSEEA
jgi:branched-chain amino acid transport system permease protein